MRHETTSVRPFLLRTHRRDAMVSHQFQNSFPVKTYEPGRFCDDSTNALLHNESEQPVEIWIGGFELYQLKLNTQSLSTKLPILEKGFGACAVRVNQIAKAGDFGDNFPQ